MRSHAPRTCGRMRPRATLLMWLTGPLMATRGVGPDAGLVGGSGYPATSASLPRSGARGRGPGGAPHAMNDPYPWAATPPGASVTEYTRTW